MKVILFVALLRLNRFTDFMDFGTETDGTPETVKLEIYEEGERSDGQKLIYTPTLF